MEQITLSNIQGGLSGECVVPGDKSISHRAVFFGALAKGTTVITHFLTGEDCMTTIAAFQAMGVDIKQERNTVVINSGGYQSFQEPSVPIDLGNSGTTARLILGVLCGLPFFTTLFGDQSLTKRPMSRIVLPLKEMGAHIDGRLDGGYLPLSVRGKKIKGITFKPVVKSAQVKSGVLLAGLLAEGETTVIETTKTRDHTENMLKAFGAKIDVDGLKISLTGRQTLLATTIEVPGDISSAAFFIVGALIVPGSKITIKDVGLNETRTGILDAVIKMGAKLTITKTKVIGGEEIGDIGVSYQPLQGAVISGDLIPRMIDELPILCLLATQAKGTTVIKDAKELRFKETDRIESVEKTLRAFGADVTSTEDGLIVQGKTKLTGTTADALGDHRIGMMIAIASLISEGETTLTGKEAINVSYPNFFTDLNALIE